MLLCGILVIMHLGWLHFSFDSLSILLEYYSSIPKQAPFDSNMNNFDSFRNERVYYGSFAYISMHGSGVACVIPHKTIRKYTDVLLCNMQCV